MRFLPVFLDLQSGPVLLVGAGDLARAKLRLLASAGARVRWHATDGNHDLAGLAAEDAARRMRERIEAVLPARIGDLAAFIGAFRKSIHARIPEFALRRRFWERIVDGPIGALVLAGRKDEAEKALSDISDASAFAGGEDGKVSGHVTLVGAGPGDPDLLTVKALRALQDADVVFYDELVSPEVLDRA